MIEEPVSSKTLRQIIDLFNQYRYEELSLSNRFYELSQDEHVTRQKCEDIRAELKKLEASAAFCSSPPAQPPVTVPQETAEQAESLVLAVYWQLIEMIQGFVKMLALVRQHSSSEAEENYALNLQCILR